MENEGWITRPELPSSSSHQYRSDYDHEPVDGDLAEEILSAVHLTLFGISPG